MKLGEDSLTVYPPRSRVRRQVPTEIKQGCTTTGYEKRVRELCEEVLETKCKVSPMKIIYLLSIIIIIYTLQSAGV